LAHKRYNRRAIKRGARAPLRATPPRAAKLGWDRVRTNAPSAALRLLVADGAPNGLFKRRANNRAARYLFRANSFPAPRLSVIMKA